MVLNTVTDRRNARDCISSDTERIYNTPRLAASHHLRPGLKGVDGGRWLASQFQRMDGRRAHG